MRGGINNREMCSKYYIYAYNKQRVGIYLSRIVWLIPAVRVQILYIKWRHGSTDPEWWGPRHAEHRRAGIHQPRGGPLVGRRRRRRSTSGPPLGQPLHKDACKSCERRADSGIIAPWGVVHHTILLGRLSLLCASPHQMRTGSCRSEPSSALNWIPPHKARGTGISPLFLIINCSVAREVDIKDRAISVMAYVILHFVETALYFTPFISELLRHTRYVWENMSYVVINSLSNGR